MKRQRKKSKDTFVPLNPSGRILSQFGDPGNLPALNTIAIGSSVFQIEQALRERRVRRAVLPLYYFGKLDYDLSELSRLIHELLVFTLVEDIDVEFREIEWTTNGQGLAANGRSVSNVCLFSGGVDSYAGLLLAQETLGSVEGVFCAHTDQARIIHIVKGLKRRIFQPRGVGITKVSVPSAGARGYAQLRGFLYLLSAGALAEELGSGTIVVTECGPTMYQPKFSPLDSTTMTTHPFVVKKALEITSLLLRRNMQIIKPFENLTKAEVVAICPAKKGLRYTHSCITQRFGTHDGTCYGCIIRRLATIAAGVEDVRYNKNPISDSNARAGNLYSLLTFCAEILTQYDDMEEFETGTIEAYGKRDLFQRFALDNYAAIHRLLTEHRRVLRPIRDLYRSVADTTGTSVFDERLAELTNPSVIPDFSHELT
jgi:7-cyano-7-deazaguanine synthase in queuosine biosynthesis